MPGESSFSARQKDTGIVRPDRYLFPPREQLQEPSAKDNGRSTDEISTSRRDNPVPSVIQSQLDYDTLARYEREAQLYNKMAKLGRLSVKEQKLQDAVNSIRLRRRTGEQDKKPYLSVGQPSRTYSLAHETSPSIEPFARFTTSSNNDRLRALNRPPNWAAIDAYDREADKSMESCPDAKPVRRRENSPNSAPPASEVSSSSSIEDLPPKVKNSSIQDSEVVRDDSVSNAVSEADTDLDVNDALDYLSIYEKLEDIDPSILPTIFGGARLDRPGYTTEKAISAIMRDMKKGWKVVRSMNDAPASNHVSNDHSWNNSPLQSSKVVSTKASSASKAPTATAPCSTKSPFSIKPA